MQKLTELSDYNDDQGNIVESPTTFNRNVSVIIRGRNNRVVVHPKAKIQKLIAVFDCDNGLLEIGSNSKQGFSMSVRVGQDARVIVGNDVTTTSMCIVSAVEGATVSFGNDVMIASGNQFRSDDGHPIFDIASGKRINPAQDIVIGDHVWFGAQAVALSGACVGAGSVIGFRSVVTKSIPNNCIAVGSPAKVVRRDIAWERPHLSFVAPPYKPDSSYVETHEEYWNLTIDDEGLPCDSEGS